MRFSQSDFLGYRIGRLLLDRKINEAENLLFDEIERDPQPAYLAVGVHFYEDLQELTDAELEAADFSRAEIAEGLEALKRLCPASALEEEESSMEDNKTTKDTAANRCRFAIDGRREREKVPLPVSLRSVLVFCMWIPGALYRAVGYFVLDHGADPAKTDEVEPLLGSLRVELCHENGEQRVRVNGDDVTGVSVRQRFPWRPRLCQPCPPCAVFCFSFNGISRPAQDVIMDGRDIGTVVLPHARLKIFLTASAEDRAARRTEELRQKGMEVVYDDVLADMKQRDYQDENRTEAPLRAADDAVRVDTTGNTLEQSVAILEKLVRDTIG